MADQKKRAKGEEDDDVVEVKRFDIPRIDLVDTPANGRRMLSMKGLNTMDPAKKADQSPDGSTAQPDPAAAPAAGDAPAPDASAPAKLTLSTPARSVALGVLQTSQDALAKLMQLVESAEDSGGTDLTIPSDLRDQIDQVVMNLEAGVKHMKVQKRKRMPAGWAEHVNGLVDLMKSALGQLAIDPNTGAVAQPAGAPAPQAPAPEANAGGGAEMAAVTKRFDEITAQVKEVSDLAKARTEEIAEHQRTIKSLQSEIVALRNATAPSAVQPSNSGSTTGGGTSPSVKTSRDFPNLRDYAEYKKNHDAAPAARR